MARGYNYCIIRTETMFLSLTQLQRTNTVIRFEKCSRDAILVLLAPLYR